MTYLNWDANDVLAAIERRAHELFESGAGLWTACWGAAVEAVQIQAMDFYLLAALTYLIKPDHVGHQAPSPGV